jgi:hypothetical protein
VITISINCFWIAIVIPAYRLYCKIYKKNIIKLNKLKKKVIYDYTDCKLCGKPISIEDFYESNKKLEIQKLINIWNNDFFGLLCCGCFEKTPLNFWIKIKKKKN